MTSSPILYLSYLGFSLDMSRIKSFRYYSSVSRLRLAQYIAYRAEIEKMQTALRRRGQQTRDTTVVLPQNETNCATSPRPQSTTTSVYCHCSRCLTLFPSTALLVASSPFHVRSAYPYRSRTRTYSQDIV